MKTKNAFKAKKIATIAVVTISDMLKHI